MPTVVGGSRFLTPGQVAEALGLHVRTLANWRSASRGPRYVHTGKRVRYRMADIDAWIAANTYHPDESGEA